MRDPRVVGGRYRCAYWGNSYTVLDMPVVGKTQWFVVRWDDGKVSKHCTTWDRRDLVL